MVKIVKNFSRFSSCAKNLNITLIHTTQNISVLPKSVLGEGFGTQKVVICNKPAKLPTSAHQTLAGEPRAPEKKTPGLQPEIYAKWSTSDGTKENLKKDWLRFSSMF